MHSKTILAALLAGATAVAAQDSPFLAGFDESGWAISTAGESGATTTYVIKCPAKTTAACGLPTDGATMVQAPSTMDLFYSLDDVDATMSLGCRYIGTTSAACVASNYGNGFNYAVSTTVAVADLGITPVTAAGADIKAAVATTAAAPSANTAAATTAASATATTAAVSSGASSSGVASSADASRAATTLATSAAASESSAAVSQSATPTSSNAGVPQITGNARWAVGGAAMALALAIV